MKNLRLNSFYNYKQCGMIFLLFFFAFSNNVELLAANNKQNIKQQPLTIKSQSLSLNLKNETAQFSKGIEIISGTVTINAATLIKKNLSLNNSRGNVEVMQLSGTPVKILIQEKIKNQNTTLFAYRVKFIPSEGILEIKQHATLSINVGRKEKTHIEADHIALLLKDNLIVSISASGKPLKYQLQPESGEKITSTAIKLNINKQTEQVNLYQAEVKQGGDKFQAGEIILDGKTGNFSANAGDAQTPSISIDLDKLKQSGELKKPVSDIKTLLIPTTNTENNNSNDNANYKTTSEEKPKQSEKK